MSEPKHIIDLTGVQVLGDKSVEIARLWVTHQGGSTTFLDARRLPDASMFGRLLGDAAHNAAQAYAQTLGISQAEAAKRIWAGLDMERQAPSATVELTDPFQKRD